MRNAVCAVTVSLTMALMLSPGWAQSVFYPAKGQSPQQQTKDQGECHAWAVQQSGFDPGKAQAAPGAPPQQGGQRVRGATRGAAVGAVGGAIAGDAGKGAAAGAAMGTMAGGMRKRDEARQQQAQAQQQQQAVAQGQAGYQKAVGACMEGRGYAVK
jgi:hypothetical protein